MPFCSCIYHNTLWNEAHLSTPIFRQWHNGFCVSQGFKRVDFPVLGGAVPESVGGPIEYGVWLI